MLERDLNTKVVFALAAGMWAAYHSLEIDPEVEDCGVLLRQTPAIPQI